MMNTTIQSVTHRATRCLSLTLAASLWLATFMVVDGMCAQVRPAPPVVAKEPSKAEKIKEKLKQAVILEDEFNRGTPRSSVEGFLAATQQRDYQRAVEYLDLRRLSASQRKRNGPKLARELMIVLDRALAIDFDLLSTDPKGHRDDGLPTYRDWLGRIETKKKPVNIFLQHVPRRDGKLIWKFSSATVAKIPQLYAEFGYGWFGDVLPRVFFDFEIFGLRAWWWVTILAFGILAFFTTMIITKVLILSLRYMKTPLIQQLESIITGPVFLLISPFYGESGSSYSVRPLPSSR